MAGIDFKFYARYVFFINFAEEKQKICRKQTPQEEYWHYRL